MYYSFVYRMVSPIRKYHIVSYKNASMYQKHQDTMVSHHCRNEKINPGVNKIIEEEIFSKSIEFVPAWIGKVVLEGYVMKALEIEKVWRVKQEKNNYNE